MAKLQWSGAVVRGHNHISISCSRSRSSGSHARQEAGRLKQGKESRYRHTLVLLPALASRNHHTGVVVHTTHCCSDCKCSGIGCIRGRNRGISISHHLPSRHSTKKPCSLQRKSEHLDQWRKWGVLKLADLPWPIQGELAIGKGDLLTPSPNFAIKEDLGAEMWKGIRAHKDLNLNLTPAGGGEGQGLEWGWSHPAENYWHSCILLKGLGQDMSGYYCAFDCVISGQMGYVRRYPPRFSCGRVEAHNESEPVTCTLPTPSWGDQSASLWCDTVAVHSGVIQHCLSDGILKRDFVFGILTRGFILLITEVDRSWRICWQECHPARLYSAMTLGADDVKSNQKVGGIIMLENINSQWYARFWNSAITLIEFALWGNPPAV